MPGVLVLPDLATALRLGFQIYSKTDDGYLVRAKSPSGEWQVAIVKPGEPA
jgi:hypothetical protein